MNTPARSDSGLIPTTTEEQKARDASEPAEAERAPQSNQLDALHTGQGDTTIADLVAEKIAGMASREIWASTPWIRRSSGRSPASASGSSARSRP